MKDRYESPFSERYASAEMQAIFSPDKKFTTWRKLWVALARAEKALGLPVTDEQITQMEAYADKINYEDAEAREREVRHDVMAHIYAYGLQCPLAKPIIHLGATSCYVGDNADLIIMRDALRLVLRKLVNVVANLAAFSEKYKAMPALAYTHLQPAQLTTIGKRAALWASDFLSDAEEIEYRIEKLPFLGSKGTTGTQASFLELFGGDHEKVTRMESLIAEEMGFAGKVVVVSGQTYSRKVDSAVLAALSQIAQSASKFSYDMRLLQGFKEMEEPFETEQIGSSAMPYKRNPMRCERISGLCRHVITNSLNPAFTAATQWLERTLDDSANRRIAVAEAFLAVDGILSLMLNVTDGLVVYPKVIENRVAQELPFMATETILMNATLAGGDRQELHEKIREHSMAAGRRVKEGDGRNDLIERICADNAFKLTESGIKDILSPERFTGRSEAQVEEFIKTRVEGFLGRYEWALGEKADVSV